LEMQEIKEKEAFKKQMLQKVNGWLSESKIL